MAVPPRPPLPLVPPTGALPSVLGELEAEAAAIVLEGAALRLAAGATERAIASLLVLLDFNWFAPEGEWGVGVGGWWVGVEWVGVGVEWVGVGVDGGCTMGGFSQLVGRKELGR